MTLTDPIHSKEKYKNHYCGPSAISIITGVTCECAAAWGRHYSGKTAIRGMAGYLVLKVLSHLGCSVGDVKWPTRDGSKPPTLNQWAKARTDRSQAYLISVGNHWVVVKGNFIYDNQEKKTPLTKTKHKRKRVNYFYPIFSNQRHRSDSWPTTQYSSTISNATKERRELQAKVRAILRLHKATLERDGSLEDDGWWVELPVGKNYDGCHGHRVYSYEEILDMFNWIDDCDPDCDCRHEES